MCFKNHIFISREDIYSNDDKVIKDKLKQLVNFESPVDNFSNIDVLSYLISNAMLGLISTSRGITYTRMKNGEVGTVECFFSLLQYKLGEYNSGLIIRLYQSDNNGYFPHMSLSFEVVPPDAIEIIDKIKRGLFDDQSSFSTS